MKASMAEDGVYSVGAYESFVAVVFDPDEIYWAIVDGE